MPQPAPGAMKSYVFLYLVRKNRNYHLSLYHGDDKHIVYHTNTIVYSTGLHKNSGIDSF